MKKHNIAVLKFGSSVLSSVHEISRVVHEVYHYLRHNYKVMVIVSAIGDTTDELIELAKTLLDDDVNSISTQEYAELLSIGENISACLFTLGLDRAGIKAKKIATSCLTTRGSIANAEPENLDTHFILNLFNQYGVLVLPGFAGRDNQHNTTLLGRGGSDFSAIFAAWALKADRCVIYKDTDGIYDGDPKISVNAKHYKCLSYEDALALSSGVIQQKALQFAQNKNFNFIVKSLGSINETLVGSKPSLFAPNVKNEKKLKVLLFGVGTVGLGVYKHLLANSHLFDIVGVGVSDLTKHASQHIPKHLISNNIQALLERDCDVVIELIGGIEVAESLISQALMKNCHVVTANKALIAEKGEILRAIAEKYDVTLHYSAAVAGAIPILEVLQQLKNSDNDIEEISGILNGTCNFILEKVKEGNSFKDAIKLAKHLGYAEHDPTADINGLDAAQKTVLISRIAFDQDPDQLDITGIQHLKEQHIHDALKRHKIIRLVAQCRRKNNKIHAVVKPLFLNEDHPLAQVQSANNVVMIRNTRNEDQYWYGKGAGQWPTAESVFADLLTLSNTLLRRER